MKEQKKNGDEKQKGRDIKDESCFAIHLSFVLILLFVFLNRRHIEGPSLWYLYNYEQDR